MAGCKREAGSTQERPSMMLGVGPVQGPPPPDSSSKNLRTA